MVNWLIIVRWIHILSGAAWLGEVITINFVLVPSLSRMSLDERRRFITRIFPRVFRLASILSVTTIAAGLIMNYMMTGWHQLDLYLASPRGFAIFVGGLLGLLLSVFHFFVEGRLESRVSSLEKDSREEEIESITRYLRIIPRLGLGVMFVIFVLMMFGARGF